MKPLSLQQEILLVTNSKISRRQFAGEHTAEGELRQSFTDKLQKASRSGMLDTLLQGTILSPSKGNKLHLWQIRPGARLLHIELCTFPAVLEKERSINPFLFVSKTCLN